MCIIMSLSSVFILLCGLFINGPYALITTAISNDLVCIFNLAKVHVIVMSP